MKAWTRTADTVRAIVLSFEFVAVAVVILALRAMPVLVDKAVAVLLRADLGTVLTLLGLPVAIAGFAYTVVKEVLHLGEPQRHTLIAWPGYWRLKMRCTLGLVWTGIGVVGVWVGMIALHLGYGALGVVAIAATFAASVASLVSLVSARFTAPDILDKNGGA